MSQSIEPQAARATTELRLRNAADSLMNLNLDQLDVSELERRIDLIRRLDNARAMSVARQCSDFTCVNFSTK